MASAPKNEIKSLLQKYNVPGPRYTSYPTVPAWSPSVTANDYTASLKTLQKDEALSLYFHLPFCERLCHFCGCMQVITTDRSRSRAYVDVLLQEINQVVETIPQDARQVSQIHFGGGTPNFLQPAELREIMQKIREHFQIQSGAEIAIEMHPRTSTNDFCDELKALGFNRISLGVQDFNPTVQELIHRGQSYEMTEAMLGYLRDLGFDSFNFDLIYGLPGQTLEGWQKSLSQVEELKPNRLAVYSYAHVPWVRPVQRSFKDDDLPSPALKLELFAKAYEFFCEHGYTPIGMDHFALAGDELSQALSEGSIHRNFMGYATQADAHQIGFGVSAISYVGGHYFQNLKELPQYEAQINKGELASFRGCLLSEEDSLRREIITQIMCQGRLRFQDIEEKWPLNFKERFASELAQLEPIAQDGLLEISPQEIKIKNLGHLFLRNIAMVFDTYLNEIRRGAKNPTFSKTV